MIELMLGRGREECVKFVGVVDDHYLAGGRAGRTHV
jgi:hypothetical protein